MISGLIARVEEVSCGRNREARAQLARLRKLRFHDEYGKPHNVEEFLHGYCDLYLAYVLDKFYDEPMDLQGEVLIRKSNGKIVHAYAVEVNSGALADARGVTLDRRAFYSQYHFKEREVVRRRISQDEIQRNLRRIEEKGLLPAIEALHETVKDAIY